MDLVTIGLAVLVLATLGTAFLAAKRWHWAHVLVVVGLVFASVGYISLLTKSMGLRLKWQKKYAEAEAGLERTLPLVKAITRGTEDPATLRQLQNSREGIELREGAERIEGVRTLQERVRVNKRLRGRLWADAEVSGINPQTGETQLIIESPQPLGLDEGALVFAFEQGPPAPNAPDDGAQYLGEFRVVAVAEQQVSLAPVLQLDDFEFDRLTRSRGPWVLHETMPVDDPGLFAGLEEEGLSGLIPAALVEEYLREGTPWTSDDGDETKLGLDEDDIAVGPDDEDRAVRFEYRRQLRDYSASFQELSRQRVELNADIQAVEQDNAKLALALKGAQQTNAYRKENGRKLRNDLAGVERELRAIEAHLNAVRRQAERAEELLSQTLAANAVLLAELTASQQANAGRDLQADPVPSRGAVDVDAL